MVSEISKQLGVPECSSAVQEMKRTVAPEAVLDAIYNGEDAGV